MILLSDCRVIERRLHQNFSLELSTAGILAITLFIASPQAFGDISVNVDWRDIIEIDAQLKNEADEPQTFVYILQVKDTSGNTVFLDWKVGMASEDGQDVKTTWIPEKKGSYTLQTFLWSDLESPAVLSDILDETRIFLNDKNIAICSGSADCFDGIVIAKPVELRKLLETIQNGGVKTVP